MNKIITEDMCIAGEIIGGLLVAAFIIAGFLYLDSVKTKEYALKRNQAIIELVKAGQSPVEASIALRGQGTMPELILYKSKKTIFK